jgi:hypothetical protein
MPVGWQYAITGAIAGLVGVAEILARYRSDPLYSLKQPPAWVYVIVNAASGVLALVLVRAFGWTFGQTTNVTLWRILVAGFGAVALFRSSLFVTKVGGTDVNVGPSVVLQGILDTFDRYVDRKSAKEISKILTAPELAGLNPNAVMTVLPVLCLALMQNFSASDQALLGAALNSIKTDPTLGSDSRMRAVVIQLAKYLGPELVTGVLTGARSLFIAPPAAREAVLQEARRLAEEAKPPTPPPTSPGGEQQGS